MKIAILSKSKRLYSTRRLEEEAKKLRHKVVVLNPLHCILYSNESSSKIFYHGKELEDIDVVIPRIGIVGLWYSIAVVAHFELMGIPVINSSTAIIYAKNKFSCLQALVKHGVKIPSTIISRYPRHLNKILPLTGGPPVIMKLLQGTHGTGVILSESKQSIESILKTMWVLGQDILIQNFIKESGGSDIRVFVVGDRAVASMKRIPKKGEFRSNIHLGGKGVAIEIPQSYKDTAITAAKAVGLNIAGVDMIEEKGEPKVIEVNSSPGFQGLEKATGKNIARKIIKYAVEFAASRHAK